MIVILMGVSGAGKTTIGNLLAQEFGWQFYDGDDFHSSANIQKMKQNEALCDNDRWSWLDRLRKRIDSIEEKGESAVIACSALKKIYRERLTKNKTNVQFICLKGEYELIKKRMIDRKNHFMKLDQLYSQYQIFEDTEDIVTVDVKRSPKEIVEKIKEVIL